MLNDIDGQGEDDFAVSVLSIMICHITNTFTLHFQGEFNNMITYGLPWHLHLQLVLALKRMSRTAGGNMDLAQRSAVGELLQRAPQDPRLVKLDS